MFLVRHCSHRLPATHIIQEVVRSVPHINIAGVWCQRGRMAAVSVHPQLVPDFQQCSSTDGEEYLSWVKEFVSDKEHSCLKLKNPPGSELKIGGLDNTIYKAEDEEVKGWGEFYLPDIVNMEVIGVVKGTSYPCDQLVLMTCEDKHVYAYDGEDMHAVAKSLQELCHEGLKYPAYKTYYNGEAFKDMNDEDWADLRKGAVGKKLEKQHQELVKSKFLEYVKSTGHK